MAPRYRYLLSELVGGLRGNLLMTVATILTVTVSLTLGGAGLLAQRQVQTATDVLYAEVEVSVFLLPDVEPANVETLRSDLEANPLVREVIYESSQEAYDNFVELYEDEPALVEAVGPTTLPQSFRVGLVDPEQFEVIESQYATYPGVDAVTDQRNILENFFSLMRAFQWAGIGVALLQLIGGAALIANVIRLSAFARREQIGIMKLVGATNWYIRLPFVLEGVVAGVVGSLGALLLLLIGERTLLSVVDRQINFVPVVGLGDVLAIAPLLLLVGAGIAALASFASLRRFLDV